MMLFITICICLFFCLQDAIAQQNMTFVTIPENQTTWATNYAPLQVRANVSFEHITQCWIYFGSDKAVVFNQSFVGIHSAYQAQYEHEADSIAMVVTSQDPVKSSFNTTLQCLNNLSNYGKLQLLILIQDCPTFFLVNLKVNFSEKADFKRLGNFECINKNAELFHSSGNLLTTTSTVCQSDATWENQQFVQCWKAAVVTLAGVLQVMDGETLSLYCLYADEGFPEGLKSTFFVGNQNQTIDKDQNYTQNVTWEDNNKEVYCQAETLFTQHFPESGKSLVKTINVMYAPIVVSLERVICEWHVNMTGLCLVSFHSNPKVDQALLFTNGSVPVLSEAKTNMSEIQDEQTFHFLKEKVTPSDNGTYTLEVESYTFPGQKLSLNFDIIVHEPPQVIPTPDSSQIIPYIIGIAVIGVLIIVSVIFNVYLIRTKPKKVKQKKDIKVTTLPNNPATKTEMQTQDPLKRNVEASDDIYDDNVAEEDVYDSVK